MTPARAESSALAIASLALSATAVVFGPELSDQSFIGRLITALLGAVSLASLFVGCRSALNRRWARPFLGLWLYRISVYGEQPGAGGAGVGRISVGLDGSLNFDADLYVDEESARRSLVSDDVDSLGHVNSRAASYDAGRGGVWVAYEAQYYEPWRSDTSSQPASVRSGSFFLRTAPQWGARRLQGTWLSSAGAGKLGPEGILAGTVRMFRPGATTEDDGG